MVLLVNIRASVAAGAFVAGLVLIGCGSGSGSQTASQTASLTSSPSASTVPPGTTPTATAGTATCPTPAQVDAALGGSHSGPIRTPTAGGGVVCEYTGGGGNATVAIFAHQTAAVFAGQVANAPGAPAMPPISGVGDGAFGQTAGGVSIVNAYSDGSRTVVAAQAQGASLAPVEALARVALADN